ncbi:unnamed protein product (macronuclear) [Paramecium tetraurelia]|uniref:C2H2-type domain-containing protein n=1 Tax=Paramecium tetraurelia TaxID=5888 RepID=A0EIR1_PARTE|nr:uncharacterized protein GSPATT00027531001 [Paramecium tetraurelia]CAK95202.1 unnamed protein product [Paramecium tetraurelia]|eukprot:XP_001462575.1 hypothetical protein (macronuclear) [Paramecium tetraurelia strain d4-2]
MFIESIDHSTPRTIQENEISEPEYDQKVNYKLEVRKAHLLQQFLRFQVENTQRSIAKLEKKLSNDEVIVELICFYLTICSLLYIFVLIQFYQVKNKRISRKNSITKPFKCSNCTHTYSSKAALKQHLKLKHYEEHTPLTQPLDQQKVLVEPLSQI